MSPLMDELKGIIAQYRNNRESKISHISQKIQGVFVREEFNIMEEIVFVKMLKYHCQEQADLYRVKVDLNEQEEADRTLFWSLEYKFGGDIARLEGKLLVKLKQAIKEESKNPANTAFDNILKVYDAEMETDRYGMLGLMREACGKLYDIGETYRRDFSELCTKERRKEALYTREEYRDSASVESSSVTTGSSYSPLWQAVVKKDADAIRALC